MLLEHITDPNSFHKACFKMLNDQGKALHFFATKFSPASIMNLLLPESWSRQLLYAIQKRNWETEGKFPAYYRWCVGPTKSQIEKYRSLGFMVRKYNGYLGSGYLKGVPFLIYLGNLYTYFIVLLKNPYLCSNSIVLLSKS